MYLRIVGNIILCLLFVIATSGNSRGLIFKNLAKTYHKVDISSDNFMPPAEEINEQIQEYKHQTIYISFILPRFEIEVTRQVHIPYILSNSPHILEIPVPPPEHFV